MIFSVSLVSSSLSTVGRACSVCICVSATRARFACKLSVVKDDTNLLSGECNNVMDVASVERVKADFGFYRTI